MTKLSSSSNYSELLPELLKYSTNLRHLEWTDSRIELSSEIISSHLTSVLAHIASRVMESITLNFTEDHIPLESDAEAFSDWTGLAEVLDGDMLLQLRLFNIHVIVEAASTTSLADLVALFGRIFSRLLVRKVLHVGILREA
jgi:hypothetical protein